MAGEIANLAQEAPLLQDSYSHNEPGESRKRKGKAKSKKRRKLSDKKRSPKSRVAKKRRSPIADAMGAGY